MSSYSTLNRLSLTELYLEDRKQRAHLKKISEMQRQTGVDNGEPLRFPQLHQNFLKHLTAKGEEISKENEVKSQKILKIMAKKNLPSPPFQPTNQVRRHNTVFLSHDNAEYLGRIAKAKGKYDAREWKNQYEQHKEHLRLRKDNKVFTPLDIGVNRQRLIKANSLMGSKYTTPTSSSLNMFHRHNKTD